MKVVVKQGYAFNYHTGGCDVGSIANISKPDGLVLDVEKISDRYHVCVDNDGVFIQIWCVSYNIERISNERNSL